MEIPQSYLISKLYTYSTKIRQTNNYYNGCCPICREGNSWGKKARLFYFIYDNYFYCHNCGRGWTPYFFIKEMTGMSFREIKEDLKREGYDEGFELFNEIKSETHFDLPDLPGEYLDLTDINQLNYYKENYLVKKALKYCRDRRLYTAVNSPKIFYLCLKDKYHGRRLIIPYFENNKIISYISRSILENDERTKYLLKFDSKKPIFNFEKIDPSFPYIFLFEGQIDSMFIKNGVAISGTALTIEQETRLKREFPFHELIWMFDNFRFEKKEVIEKIKNKMNDKEKVFLYKNEFENFKDLNAFCVSKKTDSIDTESVLKSCFTGSNGLMNLI